MPNLFLRLCYFSPPAKKKKNVLQGVSYLETGLEEKHFQSDFGNWLNYVLKCFLNSVETIATIMQKCILGRRCLHDISELFGYLKRSLELKSSLMKKSPTCEGFATGWWKWLARVHANPHLCEQQASVRLLPLSEQQGTSARCLCKWSCVHTSWLLVWSHALPPPSTLVLKARNRKLWLNVFNIKSFSKKRRNYICCIYY